MPFYLHKDEKDQRIAFWKIEEPDSFFTERTGFVNPDNLKRFTHPQARLQWLASRLLLFELLGPVLYKTLKKDASGKPIAQGQGFELSISHSDDLVAVAISKNIIGIDIQKITPKLAAVAPKFILEADLAAINLGKEKQLEQIHVHWGIKEALFKAYSKGQLDFKEHLKLNWNAAFAKEGDTFDAFVMKNDETEPYSASYELVFDNYLLCIVTKLQTLHYSKDFTDIKI